MYHVSGCCGLGQIGRRTLMSQRRMGLGAITQGDMTLVLWTSNSVTEEAEARKVLDAFLVAVASEGIPVKASRVVQEGEYYIATATFWMPSDKIEGSVPDTTPEPAPGTLTLATEEADAKVSGKTQWWKWGVGIGAGVVSLVGAFLIGRKTR